MSKYRFKTEEEFKKDKLWDYEKGCPSGWTSTGSMNKYLGKDVPKKYNEHCRKGFRLSIMDHACYYWEFSAKDYVAKEENKNWSEWVPSKELNFNGFEYFGDKVMKVSLNGKNWHPRVVFGKKEDRFIAWRDATDIESAKSICETIYWDYAKPIKTKITIQEVADKFGLDVNEIEII